MSTITLPNIRVSSDLEIRLKLKDGGVAIDWSTLTNIKASIYSDRQRSLAGRCDIAIDEEDSTILVCRYSANKPQYPGVNRVIVSCTYDGETKTYDKPAFTFVRWTDDQDGRQITIDDPDIDVEISVEDVSSSILQEAVEAAFSAAERADEAAAAAEHMVDIHTGPAGKSAYEVAVEEGYTGTEEEWLASLEGPVGATPDISIGTVTTVEPGTPAAATMTGTPAAPVLNLTIPKGVAGDTPAFTVGEVTTGEPGTPVVVTITGTPAAPVLNVTIPQGLQGNTGSSVEYPYELVNNLTTNDATKGLSAAQGKVLKDEITQLEQKVGNPADAFQSLPIQMTEGYFDVTGASVASTASASTTVSYCEFPCTPGEQFKVYGYGGVSARLWCFIDGSRNVLSVADESVDARTTPAELTAPASSAILIYQATRFDLSRDKVETPLPVKVADTLDGTTKTDWSATNQSLTAGKYYNTNSSTMPTGTSSSTGTYCAKIAVTPGEIYRITGVGGGASVRLYATAGSDYARKRYSGANVARRDCPEMVTIASDEAYLYVNLYTYDSTTDKIEKLTSSSSHEKGLIERVADLENNPVTTPVVDALNSTSTTDALSANQGRVLNEDINGITSETTEAMAIRDSKYFNTENSRVPSPDNLADTTNGSCVYVYVTPGEVYRIYGKGNSGSWQLYALADSNRYVVQDGTPGVALNTRTTPLDLTIPEGVAILVVNLYQYDLQTDKVLKVGHTTTDCVKTRLTALEDNDNLELPLKGKKIMFFGDSITDLTYNGKGLTSYFAQASLATCYKAAIGGTRFVQRTTPVDTPTTSTEAYAALDICNMVKAWCEADYTKQDAATTFLNDHTARVNALKNNPIGSVDIVCIGGGTNDMTSSSPIGNDSDNDFTTIKGAINKMVELLLTANPKLKIYFYSPVVGYHGGGGRTDANWDDNHQFSSGKTKPEYIDIFAERARKNHIPYINLYWTLGWNQTNFSQYFLDTDDHHPYKGFDVIGRRLYQQVVTNLE